jgi:hypothetical protein
MTMFCPKCATQNPEGGSFCRSCGANISLIPQALSGQLPEAEVDESCLGSRARKRGNITLDSSLRSIFMGLAFLIVSIALSRSIGAGWWFWMLIPAFIMMGTGIGQFIMLKENEKKAGLIAPPNGRALPDRTSATPRNLASPRTGELMAPVPSVTEGTTRHLGVEAPTRHFEAEPK